MDPLHLALLENNLAPPVLPVAHTSLQRRQNGAMPPPTLTRAQHNFIFHARCGRRQAILGNPGLMRRGPYIR